MSCKEIEEIITGFYGERLFNVDRLAGIIHALIYGEV